jgi:hypothetical protein
VMMMIRLGFLLRLRSRGEFDSRRVRLEGGIRGDV